MVFQECCPYKHIGNVDVLGHLIRVRLAGAHCAQLALTINGIASGGGGVKGADRVEDVCQIRLSGFDLAHDIFVTVIKDVLGSKAIDKVIVFRAASREDSEALELSELDSILANAC